MENLNKICIIRTQSAGVHYGELVSKEYTLAGTVVHLKDSRRIWSWSGAFTLSQIAMEGVTKPSDTNLSMKIDDIELIAIEIIPMKPIAVSCMNNILDKKA